MPLYLYECEACEESFEELIAAHAPAPPCPACGRREAVRRRLSTFLAAPGRRQPSYWTPAMTRRDPVHRHHH